MLDQIISLLLDNPMLTGLWLFFLFGLLITESRRGGKALTTTEVTRAINNEDDTIILDVRKKDDFKKGHLPGATSMPMATLANRMTELENKKSSPIIVICAHGTAAGGAQGMLSKAGFTNVRRMKGGILEWQAQNLPLIKK